MSLKVIKRLLLIFSILILLLVSIFLAYTNYNTNKVIAKYREAVFKAAKTFSVEPQLIFAIIKTESNFNENALSNKNACGLMQLKVETFIYISNLYGLGFYESDIFNPDTNITAGAAYLNYLFAKFNTLNEVLAAYNAGEGNVRQWLNNKDWSNDGKTLSKIPFSETSIYLRKINFYRKYYKDKIYESGSSTSKRVQIIL